MTLLELRTLVGRKASYALAARVPTSGKYLLQIAYGHRTPSEDFARKLVREDARLPLHELLPDMYPKPGQPVRPGDRVPASMWSAVGYGIPRKRA
jgi:hypothetical protein